MTLRRTADVPVLASAAICRREQAGRSGVVGGYGALPARGGSAACGPGGGVPAIHTPLGSQAVTRPLCRHGLPRILVPPARAPCIAAGLAQSVMSLDSERQTLTSFRLFRNLKSHLVVGGSSPPLGVRFLLSGFC